MMAPNAATVSIVTPAFNVGRFIEQTIDSVRAQTRDDWEMVVVDDGSVDDTASRVRAAANQDSRIRLISPGRNQGIATARNLALDAAQGRYIAFLDGDDLWDPDKLERQIRFMTERRAAFSFSSYRLAGEGGTVLGSVRAPDTISYREMLRGFRVGCLTVMLDRTFVPRIRFPPFPKASDLGGWLSVLRDGHVAHGLSSELATYRVVQNSVSRAKMSYVGRVWDVYRAEPLSVANLALCYSEYAIRGFVKHVMSGAVRVRAIRRA